MDDVVLDDLPSTTIHAIADEGYGKLRRNETGHQKSAVEVEITGGVPA